MSVASKERAEEVFLALVERDPAEWGRLLDERCGRDPELRAEVESLLGCHKDAGSFLDRQELLALTPELIAPPEQPLGPGTRFGEYTIERVIGAGGMGIVYVAQQERPRRTVALKLVNSSVASHAVLRRFELEAEMLGRLQHPGIAQIFEAGTAMAAEGAPKRPFIAMELVDGPSLLEFAQRRRLDMASRLALVASVCDAVHHAHQRGVIHRDLKPANILVHPAGQPKVLDFGVGRAIGDEQHLTMQTSVGQLIGTLPYMSPEQVLGDPREVDTRADVYALGVILYEVLTGRLPLDLANRSIPDAVAVIRGQDPVRLSSISRVYRGEVETIVGKALEKDKARRYQSAADLAADLRSYLAGRPITAKADSAFYLLKKGIQRYRHAVALGTAALIALVAFSIYATVQSHRSQQLAEAERAARLEAVTARDLARDNAEELRRNLYVSAIGYAQAAYSTNDIGRVKRVLEGCPEDLRGWEWTYLRAAADTSLDTRAFPDGYEQCTISGDGSTLLHYFQEAPLLVADGRTGAVRGQIDIGGRFAVFCVLNHAGTLGLAGTASGELLVLDLEDGTFRSLAMPAPLPVHPQALWPDGSRAMVVLQTPDARLEAHAVELESGRVLWSVPYRDQHMLATVSPDGSRVAIAELNGRVFILDRDGDPCGREIVSRGWPRDAKFSPDGARLAVGGNEGAVYVLDIASASLARHQVFGNKIWTLAWSPDGTHVAAAGTEGCVRVLDASTGVTAASHFGHDTTIDGMGWSPDGWLGTTSRDRTTRRWERPERTGQPSMRLESPPNAGAWSRDGTRFYIGGEDGAVREIDPLRMTPGRTVFTLPSAVQFVGVSRGGGLLAAGDLEGHVVLVEASSGAEVARFRSPRGRALGLSFSPDDSIAALSGDHHAVTLWDARRGVMLREFPAQSTAAIRAEYSPDGSLIAAAYYDTIVRLHDAHGGRVVRELRGMTDWSNPLHFAPDGSRLVAGCADGTIYVWDLARDEPPMKLVGHQRSVFCGSMSPDGTRFVSGGWDNTIRLWDLRSGLELLTWRPHINAHWIAQFSPDGRRFISASKDSTARLWDPGPGAAR